MRRLTHSLLAITLLFFIQKEAFAQIQGAPRIPQGAGMQGSAGVGFTDFTVLSPSADIKIDRGTFLAVSGERAFNFMNLYLNLTLSYMNAEGVANYSYTNLSSSTTYTADDVAFRANLLDLGLGFKLKLIDNYWFRPYVEGGGLGGFHEVSYTSKLNELSAQGPDARRKDNIMASGFYYEGGLEIGFTERFGVKLAARFSEYSSKALETLANRKMNFRTETYYLSGLFGF